jgi:UDP-3-O-[3-hydroxymyristoyl] glucosamine N-acyltransferase
MKITLKELSQITSGELQGDGAWVVTGAAGLLDASPQDVSFLGNPKYAAQTGKSQAGCIFLPFSAKGTPMAAAVKNRIYVEDPQWAFAQVLALIEKELQKKPLVILPDPKAQINPEARLSPNVFVGPFTVIERLAVVGEGSWISAQCYLGPQVKVGKGCKIYPQVVIRERCEIGDRVIIHSGTVIGADGFGFSTDKKTGNHRKIPQIGNVVIENDAEIGANVTIDRATVGTTRIGAGTKIDNLVQIGHNVQIGKNCLVVSQVGISGSTKIGNQVVLAGQAGIVGHVTIGDGAIITAQSGVMNDVEPKAVLFGSPARPHREGLKIQALLSKLPELYETIKTLKAGLETDPGAKNAQR